MKSIIFIGSLIFSVLILFVACGQAAKQKKAETTTTKEVRFQKPRVPDWHKNATIYELNLRHYTTEGTFVSLHQHLPRLKEMGVDILWFMPVTPVSVKNRKGELGSPYAVADYRKVNPEYGTIDDFKALLKAIHDANMYCIIDWVPNHTGWDNPWITEHPDWYTKDKDGNIIDPIDPESGKSWGWTDVADLNYDIPEMRLGMIDAMRFWINDVGIDGFRVDVAHNVPVDFWAQCSDSLYAIKPLFMLAEAEVHALRNNGAFVADYGWEMHHVFNEIAKTQGANEGGKKLVKGNIVEGSKEKVTITTAIDIDKVIKKKARQYRQGYSMHFTSNHDENSWAGTEMMRMGKGHKAFAVLAATFDGIPLIYTGQESALEKQLKFFERDVFDWKDYPYAGFYKALFELKHRNQALWNGIHGGPLVKIPTGNDAHIYAFSRKKGNDQVIAILNLSSSSQKGKLEGNHHIGTTFTEIFTNTEKEFTTGEAIELGPWDYRVYSNK